MDAFAKLLMCERQLRHPDGLTLFQKTASAFAQSADLTELPEVPDLQKLPPEVERFCIKNGLVPYLTKALELVGELFPEDAPRVQLEFDMDTDDEWITLEVSASNGVSDAVARESQFNERRISLIPWPQRDKIRIACDIV
ncbi:MAG: hypothetical protein ACHQ9S_15275 [Candidatus Binatia bacterium]